MVVLWQLIFIASIEIISTFDTESFLDCLIICPYDLVRMLDLTFLSQVQFPVWQAEKYISFGNAITILSSNATRSSKQTPSYSSILIAEITKKNISAQVEIVSTAFKILKSNRFRMLIFLTDEWTTDISFTGVKEYFSRTMVYLASFSEYKDFKDKCNIKLDLSLAFNFYGGGNLSQINSYTYENEEFCEQLVSINLLTGHINLSHSEIRASAVDTEDSTLEHLMQEDEKGKLKFVSGTSVSILHDLRDMLNFRIKAFRGEWIKPGKNHSLIGNSSIMLINHELDIHLSHTTPLPYRAVHLDFLQPTITGGIAVFLTQPEVSYFRDVCITPFEKHLWFAVILTIFILALAMKTANIIMCNIYSRILQSETENDVTNENQIVDDPVLWSLSVTVQKAWFISPGSISLKIILMTGVLFGLLCYTAYSAAIVSILSTDLNPINSLSELISSNVPLFSDKNSTTISSLVGELEKDKQLNMRHATYVSRDEGVLQLLNLQKPSAIFSMTLFFYRTLRFYNVTDQWICKYMSDIPVNMAPTISSMAISKNSVFKELFNAKIMWLKETGLHHRYLQEYDKGIAVSCTKKNSAQSVKDPLGIHDLATAYYILAAGFLLCIGLFIFEEMLFRNAEKVKILNNDLY